MNFRWLLIVAGCSCAVFAPAVLEAAPSVPKPAACAPAAFTGAVHSHAECVRQSASSAPSSLSDQHGPRGLRGPAGPPGDRGLPGIRGAAGARGLIGQRGDGGAAGPTGAQGVPGDAGAVGPTGQAGPPGTAGNTGPIGATGPAGAGSPGAAGATGATGATGMLGNTGPTGTSGATGPAATPNFADFFARMPGDNSATVAPGTPVQFPQNGGAAGDIVRLNASAFLLPDIGSYSVTFSVPVSEPGQLVLTLNGAELVNDVFGRSTGDTQITGATIVVTTTPGSTLSVDNPVGAPVALTITPLAGGPDPGTASLVIDELN
jgi:hypothetical protein